jgi:hypothetical protein
MNPYIWLISERNHTTNNHLYINCIE